MGQYVQSQPSQQFQPLPQQNLGYKNYQLEPKLSVIQQQSCMQEQYSFPQESPSQEYVQPQIQQQSQPAQPQIQQLQQDGHQYVYHHFFENKENVVTEPGKEING